MLKSKTKKYFECKGPYYSTHFFVFFSIVHLPRGSIVDVESHDVVTKKLVAMLGLIVVVSGSCRSWQVTISDSEQEVSISCRSHT